jgi:hypothetical protein
VLMPLEKTGSFWMLSFMSVISFSTPWDLRKF